MQKKKKKLVIRSYVPLSNDRQVNKEIFQVDVHGQKEVKSDRDSG